MISYSANLSDYLINLNSTLNNRIEPTSNRLEKSSSNQLHNSHSDKQPINHQLNSIKLLLINLINLISHLNQQFFTNNHLFRTYQTSEQQSQQLSKFKSDKTENVNALINLTKSASIHLNYFNLFNLFRFKIKLWLFLIITLLNLNLIKISLAQTIEEQINCLDIYNQLNSSILSKDRCINGTTIKIGYLTNFNSTSGQRLGLSDNGAIYYAISEVNNQNKLGGRKLKLIIADTRANPVHSTNSMLCQVTHGAVAFIGPDNTCLTEATVAAAINLPMISYKCSDLKVSDKKTYSTFARTVPADTGIVNSVLSLLEYYNWFHFSLIYKDKENFRKIAENLIEKTGTKFKIGAKNRYLDYSECCPSDPKCCAEQFSFKDIIETTAKQTRIWVLIGDRKEVQEFMKIFKNYNLHLHNHFVIIVDATDWDESIRSRYLIKNNNKNTSNSNKRGVVGEDDDDKKEDELNSVYRASMMITFSPPNEDRYAKFVREIQREEIKRGQKKDDDDLKAFITLYACYLYDAVILYAQALKNVLDRKMCANNGKEIIKEVININQYQSICGSQMEIDENGDVLGNYTVFAYKDFKDDNQTTISKQFIPIAIFKHNKQKSSNNASRSSSNDTLNYESIDNNTVDWINGEQPIDQPKCGFDNSQCKQGKREMIFKLEF